VTPEDAIQIFYFGLTSEAFRHVNTCAGGSLMSKSSSKAKKVLLNICLTSKNERERKEMKVEESEEELMAPTPAIFEDQLPARKTPVPYAFDEEEFRSFAPQEDIKSVEYKSLANAKPLTEFERMSWMPVEFGDSLKCAGPLPPEDLVEEEEMFPPEMPLRRNSDSQDTGEMLQKLFQEEELDSDFVSEVKRVIGVKPESSLTEEVIVHLLAEESSTGISCSINKEDFNNIRCSMEAQVSTMSYEVYSKLSVKPCLVSTNLRIKLSSNEIIKSVGLIKNIEVNFAVKIIPTDFYVINVYNSNVNLIFGRPFLKLVNAVVNNEKGKITLNINGLKYDFDFLPASKVLINLTPDIEEIESINYINAFREPLNLVLEGEEEGFFSEETTIATNQLEQNKEETQDTPVEPLGDLNHQEAPDVELKPLLEGLKYAFLGEDKTYPVIVSNELSPEEEERLLAVLRKCKKAIGYSLADLKGISPAFCTHRIPMEEDFKAVVDNQRRLSNEMRTVVKKEVIKLLNAGIIYPVPTSEWVSPVHCVPKKGGLTVVKNEKNELIPQRTVTGWRLCIDYRKLNKGTKKDHFPLPFIDEMLERLAKNSHFCYLDGYSGFFQIPIHPDDQHKTTFTCPYGTFAYRRMPFGLCNAPASFQRCMMAIFSDFIEDIMEVFMDDFSVHGTSFDHCLKNLEKVLKRCEEVHLVLNWEKCHFMVRRGLVLGHIISEKGIEVDKAKIETVEKLPPPTDIKSLRSFLGHAGFYKRFIKDFSKIAKPLTHLL